MGRGWSMRRGSDQVGDLAVPGQTIISHSCLSCRIGGADRVPCPHARRRPAPTMATSCAVPEGHRLENRPPQHAAPARALALLLQEALELARVGRVTEL